MKKCIKYLGIIIDKDLMYREHVREKAKKCQGILTALSRIMPKIGGPKEPRRQMLCSIALSALLYGAPIWANTLVCSKPCLEEMRKVQRRAALRKVCAYGTVSHDAINVLASMPPIDLMDLERKTRYELRKTNNAEQAVELPQTYTMNAWRERFFERTKGQWTRDLIPDLEDWVARKHGHMDYHLTQLFTGHGCFGNYLLRIGKVATAECEHCGAPDDTARHTFFECPTWNREREALRESASSLECSSIVGEMLKSKEVWNAVAHFARNIMRAKSDAERARQNPPQT